jgi:hypothetical protein
VPEPSSADRIFGQLTLEAADVRRAVDHEPLRRWMRRLSWGMLGGFAILLVLAITRNPSFQWTNTLPSFAFVLLIVGLSHFGIRRADRKLVESKSVRERDMAYVFDDVGYDIHSPAAASRGEWGTLERWLEVPTAFLLYVAPHSPLLVPKRAFRDDDVHRLRALLETRLGKSADAIKRAQPFWRRHWVLTLWLALMMFWTVISLVFEGR